MSIVTRGLGGRLIEQGYGGPLIPIVIVVPIPDTVFENVFIFLYRQNSYNSVSVTLDSAWTTYMNSGADATPYLTVKNRVIDLNSEALLDKQGTVSGENILFNLSVNDTDITTREGYRWQLQVRDTAGTVVKIPIGGNLDVKPILRRVL